jgi:hypothetical protein
MAGSGSLDLAVESSIARARKLRPAGFLVVLSGLVLSCLSWDGNFALAAGPIVNAITGWRLCRLHGLVRFLPLACLKVKLSSHIAPSWSPRVA